MKGFMINFEVEKKRQRKLKEKLKILFEQQDGSY